MESTGSATTGMKRDIRIDNVLDLLKEIETAVREQVMDVHREDRSMVIGIISSALSVTSDSLQQFRAKLEQSGEATPVSEEQKLQLRHVLSGAKKAS